MLRRVPVVQQTASSTARNHIAFALISHHSLLITLVLLAAVMVLAGCRREAPVVLAPTATMTPRSTPLPPVATDVPIGAEGNPIKVVIVPQTSESTARASATVVEAALKEATGLSIELTLATRDAEALGALCSSSVGTAALAWLDGITYAAAFARQCGTAALEVERGTGRDAETGGIVQLVTNKKLEITGIGGLKDSKFCRIGYDDRDSWLVPSLMLQAGSIRPLYDLGSVSDYDDVTALLEAVASGKCDAAGVPEAAFSDADTDTRDAVNVLASSPRLPYAVLVIPDDVPLGVRISLIDAFDGLTSDTTSARALKDLIGQDALKRASDDDLSDVREFVERANMDLSKLGT